MVLYATGHNAWNQLQFGDPTVGEPDDIPSFTCVLQDDDPVERVRPFLSYTQVCYENDKSRVAGMVPRNHERLRLLDEKAYASFVEASNGVVAVHDGIQTLRQYPSLRSLLLGLEPPFSFTNFPDITQLVAYDTGFAALSSTGQVWTWGDERYSACLGREPTVDNPATAPGPVTDLQDLPTGRITKLAAGAYVLAALTAGNDLYCWGEAGRSRAPADLSDAPTPVVVADDKDVVDVAVGDTHLLALTADGEVYVVGDNANGQLGLPGVGSTSAWTRIDLGSVLGAGERVTGVAAGPRNSFLMARRKPPA